MTKKDRRLLIEAISTGLMLYVPREHRADFVKFVADKLDVDFRTHFIEACLAE